MDARIKAAFHVPVTLDGRPCAFDLRVPAAGDDLALFVSDALAGSSALAEADVALLLGNFIDLVDGAVPAWALVKKMAANPRSRAALLELRALLLDGLRHQGAIHLTCPHCGAEIEFNLVGLALGLGPDPPALVHPSGFPAPPVLSGPPRRGSRPPGAATATRARLVLPSARVDLAHPFSEAVLAGAIDPAAEAAAWPRWQVPVLDDVPGKEHWRRAHPGFRALVRMALALQRLDTTRDLAPEQIEGLPLCDFLFLDAAYFYLIGTDAPPDATVTCQTCGRKFLYVLP